MEYLRSPCSITLNKAKKHRKTHTEPKTKMSQEIIDTKNIER